MSKVRNKENYYIAAFFVLCLLLCFWRALKGFCWSDESFYISTADRFYKGDILMTQEWYRTQMSSVICLPFYALYMAVVGSNTGVVLYFRILFLILSFSTAILYFRVIRKEYNNVVALICSTLIMFYAHLNVTSLSYYMMSLEFLLIALIVVYDYKNTQSRKNLLAAGVATALSVLSLPSLAVSYFLVIAATILVIIAGKMSFVPEKIRESIQKQDLWKIILYTGIGIIASAMIFIVYLLSKVNISDMIESIPYILIDNEHDFTLGFLVRKFFRSIKEVYGRSTYIAYLLICVTFIFQKYLKKKPISDLIVLADCVMFIIYVCKSFGHTGYIQAAFCLFAMPVFFLSEKKNMRLFWLYCVWGLLLAVTYCFSSSDFLYVMAIGFFVVSIACVCFVYDYVYGASDDKEDSRFSTGLRRVVSLVLFLSAIYFCCATVGLRMTNVYRDAPISKMNSRIDAGPAKGLYTTKEHLEYYEDVRNAIDEYCMAADGKQYVMFSKLLPWGYMYTDMRCAFPTTWRTSAYTPEQCEAYYKINPDTKPDVILVLKEYYGGYDACGDVEDDHTPNVDELSDYWIDYIKQAGMSPTEVKCGTIYSVK